MADPKYANLPGIDLNSPDVYETSELPEDDQNQRLLVSDCEEEVNEAIEREGISAEEAFKAFKGKSGIDASNIDFSDSVRKGRNTGYDIRKTEYEILGSASAVKETPQQKYNRLQHEFRELVDEVQQAKSALTAETSNKSLIVTVALLTSKTRLLEPSQLDQVEGRLVALNQRLTHISDKKEQAEQSDKLGKVTELYEIVQKWNGVSDVLPHVVDRLNALKELHEQALQFSQTLSYLDSAQQKVSHLLESHGDMVNEVKSTLDENMSVIRNNCETLESRVQKLAK
ncbi:hypothetical protein CAPTEDRAFT_132300 [Capitella teleta]|uniref:Dynactin subunit 2 n=1 Tax=Capitella teleta TaxID=283909 RepID=R7VAG7_CAPTE|nr:hypothetical protein CAPTEDRAFT_132300 [Capitella teleta]|eukprot:ELU15537.1 hypothetical protein CAPTEDRAFT_132300 [Capitella teleta]